MPNSRRSNSAQAELSFPAHPSVKLYSEDDAKRIWHVRESALGATVFVPGEPHGWEGWEDSAVPPEKLGSYLRSSSRSWANTAIAVPCTATIGQGCVHLRINFDLESAEGIAKFREFIDRAADIVVAHGGSFSGEHGDGQARSALLPKMFGPELIQAFREFKALWDPQNRMNPGKLSGPSKSTVPPTTCASERDTSPTAKILSSSSRRQRLALRGYSALRRCRRMPQAGRRNHVPQLHGHAAKRSTPPADAPICYGRCSKATSWTASGRVRPLKKRSTYAFPAKPAKASAR